MRYVSTRGGVSSQSFRDAVLQGQAPDGGLYVPESYPKIDPGRDINALSLAARVMAPFAPEVDLPGLLETAWAPLKWPDPAPLRRLDENLYLLELFHGPTCSFKDFGLQFLGALLAAFSENPINVIGATSGDTGAAAVHALKNKPGVRLFMLHPKGRISDLQRKQMTTVNAPNIFNIAIDGSFDDCQRLMKGVLADPEFRDDFTTINSINWGRILAQTSYYWLAALALNGKGAVHFVVPTGNFGNAFSGYVAMRAGAPISGITIATNRNDILVRTLKTGIYKPGKAVATLSPAMDIQAANNFERILFEVTGRDPLVVKKAANDLEQKGQYKIPDTAFEKITGFFNAEMATEAGTRAAMKAAHDRHGVVIDPHTAVGYSVWQKQKPSLSGPAVLLATAHPGKFPESAPHDYLKAPGLPAALSSLKEARETCHTLRGDHGALEKFIKDKKHDG